MRVVDGRSQRVRAPHTFPNRIAAEGWLSAERRLIDAGLWTPPADRARTQKRSTVRLGDFADEAIIRRDLTPKTRSTYRHLVDAHIRPHLGDRQVISITADDLADWWATLDSNHATTRAHAWNLLKSLLREATETKIISVSPADDVRFRRYGVRPKGSPVTMLAPHEIDAVAAKLPSAYQVALPLMAWCALRFGELTELRVKDIHDGDDGMVLRIRRSAPLVDGVPTVRDALKTAAGRRDIHVPPHVAAQLRDHLTAQRRRAPDDLVVTTTHGRRLSQSAFTKTFKAALPAHAAEMRVHDLRHTGAVLAAQSGATTKELMFRLGHSTSAMAQVYQHVADGRDKTIADAMSRAVAEGRRNDPGPDSASTPSKG